MEGYMLENVRFGMYYYFRKDAPKHMLYEIDRFDLKRNPNLAERTDKKNFRNYYLSQADALKL